MITFIKADDPYGLVNVVTLVHESNEAVILEIDCTIKRPEVDEFTGDSDTLELIFEPSEDTPHMDRWKGTKAILHVTLPFRTYKAVCFTSCGRYTVRVCIYNKDELENKILKGCRNGQDLTCVYSKRLAEKYPKESLTNDDE